jgi:hypothetical protein
MDRSNGSENESKNGLEIEKALREYDHALEIAHHNDNIIHEVTAIVWGANTLLLGFILEVPCDSKNQRLVIVASIVGVFMSLYVPWINNLKKKNLHFAYRICRQIEDELSLPHRLNNSIHATYPKGEPGFKAVTALTIIFVVAWVGVIWHACACLSRGV